MCEVYERDGFTGQVNRHIGTDGTIRYSGFMMMQFEYLGRTIQTSPIPIQPDVFAESESIADAFDAAMMVEQQVAPRLIAETKRHLMLHPEDLEKIPGD